MLSSQALNGPGLGPGLTQLFEDTMSTIKMFGNLQKVKNLMQNRSLIMQSTNLQCMKEAKNNETVGHLPRKNSRIFLYFIARGGKMCGSDWPKMYFVTANSYAEELRFLVGLVLSCLSKEKINRLKDS